MYQTIENHYRGRARRSEQSFIVLSRFDPWDSNRFFGPCVPFYAVTNHRGRIPAELE